MHQIDQDMTYLRSTVDELEEYLLSGILFWPVSARGGKRLQGETTQLTIGNLLLSIKRLKAFYDADDVNRVELVSLNNKVQEIRAQWKSNWDKKACEEIRSRLKQWQYYVAEIFQFGEGKLGDYSYNIRQRVILDLLLDDIDTTQPKEKAVLATLDYRLKNAARPTGFVWDKTLKPGFPEDRYWYLYRIPAM